MHTIAVVEDDRMLNEALARMLQKNGYQVIRAHTLAEGRKLAAGGPDLMIVDIGLPDGEGLDLCRMARREGEIPVLFLTARDEEADMLRAFDCGADDYLVKPFSLPVLLKHVEAILRRSGRERRTFRYQGLTVDFDRKQVFCGEEPVRLTAREYALLELLVKNQGRVVTRKLILQQIWDAEGSFVEENTVNVTLNRLRKKIEPDPSSPVYIRNVFGMGYTFGE